MIIFLHGFGSTGDNSIVGEIVKASFPYETVISPTFNAFKPDDAAQAITNQLAHVNSSDVDMVVGTGVGTLWARWISESMFPCAHLVQINPLMHPEQAPALQQGSSDDPSEFAKYNVLNHSPDVPITVILGLSNAIADNAAAINHYAGRARIHMTAENEYSMTAVKIAGYLIEAFNTVCG